MKLLIRVAKILIVLMLVGVMCLCMVAYDNSTVAVEQEDFYSEKLPLQFYGYRVMLISDFHNSFFFDQVADIANNEKPDLILFLGDMSSLEDSNMENTVHLLDSLPEDIPVYGILGNHESWSPNVYAIQTQLKAHSMHLLNNEKVVITRENASIDLIGVRDVIETDDRNINGDAWFMKQMRLYLSNTIDGARFTLLACHRSNMYPVLNDLPATLMLSGHLHGGLVRLPRIEGLISPYGSLLPDYTKGFYAEGEMDLYVSSGCDFNIRKPRVFNGPSVTILTLKS